MHVSISPVYRIIDQGLRGSRASVMQRACLLTSLRGNVRLDTSVLA